MTNLPATFDEAQAEQWAREWVAHLDVGDVLGLGCSILDPEAGPRFLRHLLRRYGESSAHAQLLLVELARAGWDDADAMLRECIIELLNRGEPLPSFLATYNAAIMAGFTAPRPRGRKKSVNQLEDLVLCALVIELVERFGFKPTRNLYSPRKSACSIAARVLRPMKEDTARKVWERYGPVITNGMRGWRRGRFRGSQKGQGIQLLDVGK